MTKHAKQDGERLSRRAAFEIGGLGSLGLSLGGLLRAQTAAAEFDPQKTSSERTMTSGREAKIKSCIVIFYYGGPSHIDTFDTKPDAPAEIRGEFRPIATSVPGLHVCEHLPRMAKLMHKVALVRSLHHNNRLHDSASYV